METFVVRVWLPDRPGVLGAVASRVGAVRGDVVGIEILERGAGRAIDELVVQLPDAELVEIMVREIGEIDGVDVEDVRHLGDTAYDPQLDALDTAARLVDARGGALFEQLAAQTARCVECEWLVIVERDSSEVLAGAGQTPADPWLRAYLDGVRHSGRLNSPAPVSSDVIWAPLPSAHALLVVGREGVPFRERERRHVAALARIADALSASAARA
ncbi:MAG: hypothetical protein ACKVWR_02195 [Acidimicrobiales bacterium]